MSKFDHTKPKKGSFSKPRSLFDDDNEETRFPPSSKNNHNSNNNRSFSSNSASFENSQKDGYRSSETKKSLANDNLDFTINRKWAASYEERKRRQELERAKELGITLSSSETAEPPVDSEEDVEEDHGNQLTKTMDKQIWKTIQAIRNKDPKIYDPNVKYFESPPSSDNDEDAEEIPSTLTTSTKTKTKKITAKDVLRQQLLEAAEQGKTDAFDEDEDLTLSKRTLDNADRSIKSRMYDEEQKLLRQEFLTSVSNEAGKLQLMQTKIKKNNQESNKTVPIPKGTGNDNDDDFLKVRRKIIPGSKTNDSNEGSDNDSDLSVERNELKKYLQDKTGKGIAEHAQDLANPDKFLSAFMGSRAWKDLEREEEEDNDDDVDNDNVRSRPSKKEEEDDNHSQDSNIQKIIEKDEEDEEELWKADDFEAAYNFRFEEPNGGQIVTYNSRKLPEDSLRVKDSKRKEARDRKKERKETERAEAEAETRRLINLKRAELKSRMSRIKDIAGNGVDLGKLADVFGDNLDKDFDPDEYDKQMNALFNDDYYAEAELEDAANRTYGKENDVALKEIQGTMKKKNQKTDTTTSKGNVYSHDNMDGNNDDDDDPMDDSDDDNEEDAVSKRKVPAWIFGDGPRPAWAGPSAEELAEGKDDFDIDKILGTEDDSYDGLFGGDDEETNENDDSYDPATQGRRRRDGKRKREAKKRMSAVARVKSILAAEAKAVQERQRKGGNIDEADEILALGFEDIIAGGLKTRFKYKTVPPQDYGLTTEEILLADDKDLNTYVGLRRMAPYREEEWSVPKKVRQRAVSEIRKNVSREIERLGLDKANIGGKKGHAVEDMVDPDNDPTETLHSAKEDATIVTGDGKEKKIKKDKKEQKERKEKDVDKEERTDAIEAVLDNDGEKEEEEDNGEQEQETEQNHSEKGENSERKRKRRRKHKHSDNSITTTTHATPSSVSGSSNNASKNTASSTSLSSSSQPKEHKYVSSSSKSNYKHHSSTRNNSSSSSSSSNWHTKQSNKQVSSKNNDNDRNKLVTLSGGTQMKQSRLSSYQ